MNDKIDAVISELCYQRMVLGDRAAALAGELADTRKKLAEAEKRIAELEKTASASLNKPVSRLQREKRTSRPQAHG